MCGFSIALIPEIVKARRLMITARLFPQQ
jgi:hypothetical protein